MIQTKRLPTEASSQAEGLAQITNLNKTLYQSVLKGKGDGFCAGCHPQFCKHMADM
jgi:hypothetical protein